MIRQKSLRTFLLSTAAVITLTCAAALAPVAAQERGAFTANIAAQDLGQALTRLGDQAGVNVLIDAGLVAGHRSRALSGSYSLDAALSQMLAGSGLTWHYSGAGTIAIIRAGETGAVGDSGAVDLGTIFLGGTAGAKTPAEEKADTWLGAGTSAYISGEQIFNARGSSPGDILSGIPGVMNGENRNSGGLDVNIRGMQGQGRAPVVIDGAMQESTVYRGYAGMAGRTYLDPDFLGGVSIEKGPSTGPDATGAVGGIVRARTLNPNDIIAPGGTWGLRYTAGFSGNNASPPAAATIGGSEPAIRNFDRPSFLDLRGYNTSLVLAYRFDKVDFLAGYARRKNGNYFAGEKGRSPDRWDAGAHPFGFGEQVTNSSIDNTSWLLRTVIRPNSDHTLDLSYMRYDSQFGEMKPSQLMYGDTPYQTTSTVLVDTYTARYRYNPDNPLIDLRADLWATNVDAFTVDPIRLDFGGGYIYNMDMFAATLSERVGLTLHNTSRFEGAMGKVSLNYGFALDREDFGKSKDWERLNAAHPGSAWDTIREGDRTQKSAFLTMEYKPAAWATFNLGARFTHSEVQDTKAGSSWVQGGVINHDKASGWAPSFSALIEPFDGIQFYSRYAEALRAASPFEATEGFSGSVNPYSNLKMEHAHNTEIGVNILKSGIFTGDDTFQAKIGWFNNAITDYITLGSERLTSPGGVSTDILVRTNIPLVEMRGVELSGRYDMGRAWMEFGATEYSSVKTCFRETPGRTAGCYEGMPATSQSWFGSHIPPKRTVSATFGGRFLDESLNVAARYTHIESDQPYEIVDLFGSYRINDKAAVSFAVDNLFDKYYVDALSLGRGVAVPASPGRTLRLSFIATLGDGERSRGTSAEDRANIAALASMSEAAKAEFNGDWSGYYAGIHWGGTHMSTGGNAAAGNGSWHSAAALERPDLSTNAMIAGLQGGYNHQMANGLVIGFELDANLGRARGDQNFGSPDLDIARWGKIDTYQASYRQSFGPSLSARLRVGKSLGRALFYGTGGIGLVEEKLSRTEYRADANYGIISMPYFTETDSKLRAGVVLGGGVEYAISNQLSIRGEYLYGNYGSHDFGFARAGSGVARGSAGDGTGRKVDSKLETHSVRIGLNYRF